MMYWDFDFSTTPGHDVNEGEIRFDAGPPYPGRVTKIFVDSLDRDGAYVRNILLAYPPGDTIVIETTAGQVASFRLTGTPRPMGGIVVLPVMCLSSSTLSEALPSGRVTAAFLSSAMQVIPRARIPRDAATDPDLITLDRAKTHLNITDVAHDDDVQQKLTAASATIRDYLKDRNDPTWTPETVPPWIQSSVLLLLGHLYEHRGDAFGSAQDNDDRVWNAIANLCRRSRDPALA